MVAPSFALLAEAFEALLASQILPGSFISCHIATPRTVVLLCEQQTAYRNTSVSRPRFVGWSVKRHVTHGVVINKNPGGWICTLPHLVPHTTCLIIRFFCIYFISVLPLT